MEFWGLSFNSLLAWEEGIFKRVFLSKNGQSLIMFGIHNLIVDVCFSRGSNVRVSFFLGSSSASGLVNRGSQFQFLKEPSGINITLRYATFR